MACLGRPVRIAYVTETWPPEVNGVALTAARTLAHLRAAGHEVLLVRPRQRDEAPRSDADEWRTAGGPIPMYPGLRYGLARVGAMRARWRAFGPHIVHVTTPGPLGFAALRAARAEGIATGADFRTHFPAYSRHYGLGWCAPLVLGWLRRLHALADVNFVPTRALARELAAQGFGRLQVVGRGVDGTHFSPMRRDVALRRAWRAHEHTPVLLHVGRLAAEKNVRLALAAFEQLRLGRAGLRMVVVGDGPLRARLEAEHPHAVFTGQLLGEELARAYASADVFLFPSLTDTFGNVTLEALASGLAVVAYDTAAAAQHIHDGVDGLLAAPGGGTAAFVGAAVRALAVAAPGSALRQAAVESARRAAWDGVLRRFEQQLVQTAATRTAVPTHAALA